MGNTDVFDDKEKPVNRNSKTGYKPPTPYKNSSISPLESYDIGEVKDDNGPTGWNKNVRIMF